MDSIYRLIVIYIVAIAVGCFAFNQSAHANYTPSYKWVNGVQEAETPQAVCTLVATAAGGYFVSATLINSTLANCRINYETTGTGFLTTNSSRQAYCPTGVGLITVGGQLTCPGDPPPPPCEAGKNDLNNAYSGGFCVNKCVHDWDFCGGGGPVTNGVPWCRLRAQTGASCTTSDATPSAAPAPTEASCAAQGKGSITMNGVTACVAAGTPSSTPFTPKPTTTTTNNTTTTNSTTTTNNTTTTTSTTFNGDGTATTTTTTATTAPNGTVTTSIDGKTEPIADYCKTNPTAKQCKAADKGEFGGACGSWTCDGDASTCAIAKKQHELACQLKESDSTSDLGKALIEGSSANGVDPFATPHEVDVGTLSASSWLPKSCLADISFNVVGQTIVLPLSRLCEGLQTAGKIVLAFAYMLAARIIFS